MKIDVRSFKLTVVLPAEPFATLSLSDNAPPQELSLHCEGRKLTLKVKAKSLRQAVRLIGEHDPESVVVLVQGKLSGDQIVDAGLVAQLKQPKQPAVAAPAAAEPPRRVSDPATADPHPHRAV